jgi:hypothetical protein
VYEERDNKEKGNKKEIKRNKKEMENVFSPIPSKPRAFNLFLFF